jgi:hypothetical protein
VTLITRCGSKFSLAQGMPDRFGGPVVDLLVCFFQLHAWLRTRQAPGIPCALSLGEGTTIGKPRQQAAAATQSRIFPESRIYETESLPYGKPIER